MTDPRDLLEQISTRFAELQGQLEGTRAELENANKRIASYENFHTELGEAVRAALVRTQEELLPRLASLREELASGEQQRDALRRDIERLRGERSELEAGIAALRPTSTHLQSASAETLRAVIHQALDEIRTELSAISRAPVHEVAAPRTAAVPEPAPFSAPEPAPFMAPEPSPEPEPEAPREALAERPRLPIASEPEEPEEPEERAARATEERVERPEEPAYDGLIEDVDDGRAPAATERLAAVDRLAAVEVLADDQRQVELVLKSVRSFPQLIALENRIQSFPGVTRVYMHRAGVDGSATLTVQLDAELDRDGFVARLEQNDRPQLQIESVRGAKVEARIES